MKGGVAELAFAIATIVVAIPILIVVYPPYWLYMKLRGEF